ncbi:MAG: hypothetical protein M3373_10015 [Gemmatimonadota bacterium]|nr:hypothetical protein [Gemmatimonadota bacterium]
MFFRPAALVASAALASIAVLAAAPVQSQSDALRSSPPATLVDTLPHHLRPIDVTAPTRDNLLSRVWRTVGLRAELGALERENRALERDLARYDRRVAELEERLASAKAMAALKAYRIAQLDSATAATRAERERLEARVRALTDARDEGPRTQAGPVW